MVASLAGAHTTKLRYIRHRRDLGSSANILAAVETARGVYCWTHSSDDAIAPGALRRVLAVLEDGEAQLPGMLIGRANYDGELRSLVGQGARAFEPPERHATIRYSDSNTLLCDCGLYASFLSIFVVRTDLWRDAVDEFDPPRLAGETLFPQVAVFALAARRDPTWVWCPAKLIHARGGDGAALARDEGLSSVEIHMRCVADLDRLYSQAFGRRHPVRRSVLRRCLHSFCTDEAMYWALDVEAATSATRIKSEAQLIVAYGRRFWSLPEYWLLIPRAAAHAVRRSAGRRIGTDPLGPRSGLARVEPLSPPRSVEAAGQFELEVRVTNRSDRTLHGHGPHAVVSGFRWDEPRSGAVVLASGGWPISRTIPPKAARRLAVPIVAPELPGRYVLHVNLARPGVGWFNELEPGHSARLELDVSAWGWNGTLEVR